MSSRRALLAPCLLAVLALLASCASAASMAAFKAQVAYPHALFAVIGDPHVYDPHVYDASLSSLWHGLPPADNDVDLSLGP